MNANIQAETKLAWVTHHDNTTYNYISVTDFCEKYDDQISVNCMQKYFLIISKF